MTQTTKKKAVRRRSVAAEQTVNNGRIPLADALAKVVNICSAEGYRDRTLRDYEKFWGEFFTVVPRDYLDEVTTDDFRAYINVLLRKRGLSPVTANVRMNALRAVFNRLYKEGMLGADNPVAGVKKLKTDEQKVGALNDEQVRRLFAVIDKMAFAGYRDYCAMLTMLKCGLRINEINSLEINDIDFDNGIMMLPGEKNKNRKTRAVPMSAKVMSELKQFIREVKEYFADDIKTVFVNNVGDPLDDELIRKRMYDYGKKAGLSGDVRTSPHNLRHTFAVNFLKNGGDIRALQKILGHRELSTTQVYLNYTDEDIKEKYEKASLKDTLDV